MTPRLIEIGLDFTVSQRPDFDSIALARDMRTARDRCGLTIGEVADRVGVPRTEAEHWFRTDTYNSPPDPDKWDIVRSILGISGWDIVGETYATPNIHEMQGRAYSDRGISPTILANSPPWIQIGA